MSATRCSPTSTETSSSRLAFGSGGRRAGTRRRDCCWERWRFWGGLRSGFFSAVFGSSVLVAVSVVAVAEPAGFRRLRPPRDPRRRRGLVACAPASADGWVTAGGAGGGAVSLGALSGRGLRRNSFSKRKLLLWRARRRHPKGGARAAWVSGKTHKNLGSYGSSRCAALEDYRVSLP